MNSEQILDREFLEIRAKILEVAAALDRLDRVTIAWQTMALPMRLEIWLKQLLPHGIRLLDRQANGCHVLFWVFLKFVP